MHLVTECHAEARSRAAQGSGIWELWAVISRNFSTHSMSTTITSNTKHSSSSPDAEQSRLPNLHWDRLPTTWSSALLVTSLLALNKLHIHCINELLSEPAVLHSQVLTRVRAPPPPGNNIYDTFSIGTRPGYNIRQFITAFTKVRLLAVSWARSTQSVPPYQFLKVHFNIILSSMCRSSKRCFQ